MKNNEIALNQARRVLEVVNAGLCAGMGIATPGQMCVEAAVCYALGQPHGDKPGCVNNSVRQFQIMLNDATWSSNEARAQGMRRLAIAQLGTNDPSFDEKRFVAVLIEQTILRIVPNALRSAIKSVKGGKHKQTLEEAAVRCERDGDQVAAQNARRVATAARAFATTLATAFAEEASYAASYASYAASYASSYADNAANAAITATAAAFAANAATEAGANGDIALNVSAEIGIAALRAAGAHGIVLMDQLIPA